LGCLDCGLARFTTPDDALAELAQAARMEMTRMNYARAQGWLITRDAHETLAVLKKLVDSAERTIRLAERETAAVAIGQVEGDDPLRMLLEFADTLQSPNFETAVSVARDKTKTAVDWHTQFQN
jgi:hypothetical protein